MKKMFMSALFVMDLILPVVSFSDGGSSIMDKIYPSCNVSGVSQYPDKLEVEVSNCTGAERISLLFINIENPMMLSISSMAQNALVSGKKIQFSTTTNDISPRTGAVVNVYSFNLSSKAN